ncbi:MAG: PKD domain-containing protein [Bacteroidetes bacterium]|nr:PKD domain-containing protein [Bacteroidota bacterium]
MRTLVLANVVILFLSIPFFYSCEEDPDPPVADFKAVEKSITSEVTITFNDLSTNADSWEWYFPGGKPLNSNEQSPTVTYSEPGSYDVVLTAKNSGGESKIRKDAYINIAYFVNELFTDIELTFNDRHIIIPKKASAKFSVIDEYLLDCHLETQVQWSSGKKTGLLIYWDWDVDLTEYSYFLPGLSSDYVFFYIQNSSNYNLTHFHVNVGNPDFESIEEFLVPNDGVKYGIGYYVAIPGMQVRSYYSEGYFYGIEPNSLQVPWTNNQSVDLIVGDINKIELEKHMQYSPVRSSIPYPKNILENIDQSKVKILTQTGAR